MEKQTAFKSSLRLRTRIKLRKDSGFEILLESFHIVQIKIYISKSSSLSLSLQGAPPPPRNTLITYHALKVESLYQSCSSSGIVGSSSGFAVSLECISSIRLDTF